MLRPTNTLYCIVLSCCVGLNAACSTLGDKQNAPVVTTSEAHCGYANDNEDWQISSSATEMTVRHRYQNLREHCEKKGPSDGQKTMVTAVKGSSLLGLLTGQKVAATVDLELDPPHDHSHQSNMHFTAI